MQDHIELTGGCLCGDIRYTTIAMPFAADYCHCKMCQRSTGSIAGIWMDFLAEQVVWQSRQQLQEFASSEFARRGFCSRCGSTLSYRDERHSNYLSLAVASLDDADKVQPTYHIFTDSQLAWLRIDDDCRRHPQTQKE